MSIADQAPDSDDHRDPLTRPVPHDREAEQAVLGGMLLSVQAIEDVAAFLAPGDFYAPAHETIYRAILDMYGRSVGRPAIDPITVSAELTERGQLDKVGGAGYLHGLVQAVPTAANAEYYAEIVQDRATLRRVIAAGMRMVQMGHAALEDSDRILETAMAELQAAAAHTTAPESEQLSVADRWPSFVDELEAGADPAALDTPWRDLNDVIELKPGQLITVGAATAGGKSLFGMNLATHVALRLGKPALVASMEMAGSELMSRLTSAEASINLDRLVRRQPTDSDWERLARIDERMRSAQHFVLDDSPQLTLSKIRARIRWMASRGKAPALVVADYLQLLTPENTKKSTNRAQEVADISRGLKLLAMEFSIPVVALAQFNRGQAGRRPLVTDFKESSSIEQDSNIILLLHRELAEDGTDTGPAAGLVECIVAKNRNGAAGRIVDLAFQGHMARLASVAH